MAIVSYVYPRHIFEAAALNAYLSRGYDVDTAVKLAEIAATKMIGEDNYHEEYLIDDVDADTEGEI